MNSYPQLITRQQFELAWRAHELAWEAMHEAPPVARSMDALAAALRQLGISTASAGITPGEVDAINTRIRQVALGMGNDGGQDAADQGGQDA